ncbi:MAG TPA: twin-arginine translocation signal domain-containing protein [Thermoguttaceae bacterium]|nr:twin-arginine translocation signal domain-containing protein [Thermoguttaceae bacterium]
MKGQPIRRRNFLKAAAAGAAGIVVGRPTGAEAGRLPPLVIEEPFCGAVLNRRHGEEIDGGLKIRVSGQAPIGQPVTVNGTPAVRAGTRFAGEVVLRDQETEIIAATEGVFGAGEHRVRVVWDRHSFPRYRFSVDDNSFFLRDVAAKKYPSLFDSWYLKIFQDLHTKYGARFVLNIYYATEDGFELPQFPDRYKGEWKDNADWLCLAFHAYANKPDRPYQYASPGQLIADLDKVAEEIHRFAGEETYSPPTVIHWGMVQPTALKPLAERGVRVLSGDFRPRGYGWDVNYFLDADRSEHLSRHDALMDFASGIVFSSVDIVCNNTPLDRVVPTLAPLAEDPGRAEIMDLFTHEQYFWPFYVRHVPDHAQRLEAAIRWVTEHGYKPVMFHEGFLGAAGA